MSYLSFAYFQKPIKPSLAIIQPLCSGDFQFLYSKDDYSILWIMGALPWNLAFRDIVLFSHTAPHCQNTCQKFPLENNLWPLFPIFFWGGGDVRFTIISYFPLIYTVFNRIGLFFVSTVHMHELYTGLYVGWLLKMQPFQAINKWICILI